MNLPLDALPAAAYLFEKSHGRHLHESEAREIAAHGLTDTEPALLAQALQHTILRTPTLDSTYRQQAYWALGKNHDLALVPFFRQQLTLELFRDLVAVHQLLIALDNLGEPVFPASTAGASAHEDDANRKCAEAYLARLG